MSYYIHQKGDTCGPYTIGQLRSMWAAGQVTGETLYCGEGYDEWLHLRELADELDPPAQPPIAPQLPPIMRGVPPPFILQRKSGVGRAWLIGALVVVGILAFLAFLGSLGSTGGNTLTVEYARRVNGFADKHDMTVEEVMRWDFVLTQRGLTLADFDQASTKFGQSRDKAVGYHVEPQKKNFKSRRLAAGDTMSPQNPTLTQEEESAVKILKLAGY